MVVLWACMGVVALVSWVCVAIVIFGAKDYSFSPSDMWQVSRAGYTTFCSELDVSSTVVLDVFLLSDTPTIDRNIREDDAFAFDQTTVFGNDYNIQTIHLLSGSYLTKTAHTASVINQIFIKGSKNLEKWKSHRSCVGCTILDVSTSWSNWESQAIGDADDYYILYVNWLDKIAVVTCDLCINRSLAGQTQACRQTLQCYFEIYFDTREPVVFHYHRLTDDNRVSVKCLPRVWMYCILFMGVPGVVGILLAILLHMHLKRKQTT